MKKALLLIKLYRAAKAVVLLIEERGIKDELYKTRAEIAIKLVLDALKGMDVNVPIKRNTIELLIRFAVLFNT